MVQEEYFIGIDVGTQSTKTIVFNALNGEIICRSVRTYKLIEGLPFGHKEQDPAVWIDAVNITMETVLDQSEINRKKVKAIGVSAQQHGLVVLDLDGNVIRPAKLWNDTSTMEECEIITHRLGGKKAVLENIGLAMTPGFTAPKILWLKRKEPENYKRIRRILLPHDYINYYLTGVATMEYGDASGTALMEIRSRKWHEKIIEVIDPELRDKLPFIQGSDKPVGTLRKAVAERFRLTEDVLVSAGGGDNMMGAIGTGNTRKGVVTASLGTSGTVYAYSDVPIVDPKGEIAAFCDSTNCWLPLLCTMNVTVATEYVRKMFDLSHNDLEKVVRETPCGSEGLILVPYFEGERTPNIPDGTGVYFGLNKRTFNKKHLVRSAMEGVTLGMNYGLNRMKELGIKPRQMRLTGGGSGNRIWRQIAADIFDVEVVCLNINEGAAYGAALQALWIYRREMGAKVTIQQITDKYVQVNEEERAFPRESNARLYRELQRIQDSLSLNLRETFSANRRYLRNYVKA